MMSSLPPFLQAQADFRAGRRYENPHPVPQKGICDAPHDLYKQGWRTAKWRYEFDTGLMARSSGEAA